MSTPALPFWSTTAPDSTPEFVDLLENAEAGGGRLRGAPEQRLGKLGQAVKALGARFSILRAVSRSPGYPTGVFSEVRMRIYTQRRTLAL